MFDPAGGTAPDIAGKNVANPAAVLLAFGMLLNHVDRYDLGHALAHEPTGVRLKAWSVDSRSWRQIKHR